MTIASDRQLILLALCRIRGLRWDLIAREAQRPGGLERLVRGDLTEASEDTEETQSLLRARISELDTLRVAAAEEADRAEAIGARLTTVLDDDYPVNLRLIYNLPPFLFYRGELSVDDVRSVAVVGTRTGSVEGLDLARRVALRLTENRVTVVSGLARGIDTAAHKSTLESGGRTIAVLGTGILNCYPPENEALADEITTNGALVSQFWPSAPPASYNFPRRNVVTSGISQGTVVVEAKATSGAKMQARLALEHGKRVFLVSSLVTSQNWAQKYLRRPGVVEVRDVEDVLRHLREPHVIDSQRSDRQMTLDLI